MGCVPCAAKARARAQKYEWSQEQEDGTILTVVYPNEVAAKAKVRKKGGSYKPLGPT